MVMYNDSEAVSSETQAMNVTIPPLPKMEDYWEFWAGKFLYTYPNAVFTVVGLVGNLLAFLVYSRPSLRQSVTSLYFRVLAVIESVVLVSGGIFLFLLATFHYDWRIQSTAVCKIVGPVMAVSCYQSCWVLVLMSIDRFIGVYFPHKYRQFCSKSRARTGIILTFLAILISVGGFLVAALDLTSDKGNCTISKTYTYFYAHVYQFMDMTLLNLVPTIVLVTLNLAIVVKISKASAKRQTANGGKNESKVSSATVILLSVSVIYFLCTIPSSTAFLVKQHFRRSGSPRAGAQIYLYQSICDTLYILNHAINFFLYCVHGSGFRKELAALFGMKVVGSSSSYSSTGTHQTDMSKSQTSVHEKSDPGKI